MSSVEKKTAETPKHLEHKNATQGQGSTDEKSPTVCPEQSVTGKKMTYLQLEEAEIDKKLEAERSHFLKRNKELLELLDNLQRLRPEEVLQNIEQWTWMFDFHALLMRSLARASKKQEDKIDEKE